MVEQAQLELQLKVWKELAISKQMLMRTAAEALKLDPNCSQEELKTALEAALKKVAEADASVVTAREQAKSSILAMEQKLAAAQKGQATATASVRLMPQAAAPLAGRGRVHLAAGRPHAAIRDFSRAVTAAFDKGRGLALGVTASASVVSGALVPVVVHNLLGDVGWRGAIFALGVMTAAMLPIVAFGLRPPKRDLQEAVDSPIDGPAGAEGLLLPAAVREWRFWAIGASFLLMTFATTRPS